MSVWLTPPYVTAALILLAVLNWLVRWHECAELPILARGRPSPGVGRQRGARA
jgi:hypothetical protein